jgi:DNA-binding transcriptional LysR family regulator
MIRPMAWVGVELRHFLALEAIAEERSFNRAAARLGYTQSAISQQIATLERVVGERLVDRGGGAQPISLTPAGEILLSHARGIGSRLAMAQTDLEANASGTSGPLRIGTFQSVGATILPEILQRFGEIRADTGILLTESHLDLEFFRLIESGELDVAFVHMPIVPGSFDFHLVLQDDYVLLVQETCDSIRPGDEPSLKEIASLPLIGFQVCRSLDQVITYFRVHDLEPNFVLRSDDCGTIAAFVERGLGAALVPRLVAKAAMPHISIVELRDGPPPRGIALTWSSDRTETPVVADFIAVTRSLFSQNASTVTPRSDKVS